MSYRVRTGSGLGTTSIDVGERARHDPILARASLLASEVMLAMAKAPESRRLQVMSRELRKLAGGLDQVVAREFARLRANGEGVDQATFDAMRLAIANRLIDRGFEELKLQTAEKYGWDALLDSGLGDETARQAGCVATGATTAILGTILSVYTGGVGGSVASTGGSLVGQALDCNRNERLSQERQAAARAAEAAANLQRAQIEAQRASAAAQARQRTMLIGGGILGIVAISAILLLK